jgi:glutathione S-transferase
MVLEALGLKYETQFLEFSKNEQKAPEFTKYNPNGRESTFDRLDEHGANQLTGIPAIIDHDNDDFVLWESNTIIKYLADRYDKENKIHFPAGSKDSYLVDQWMTFQASGQVRVPLVYFCGAMC